MIRSMPRVISPVFVGRVAELDRLRLALDEAYQHRPGMRLVAGEAGIGKTRLLTEFAAQAEQAGALVLRGDCLQLGNAGLPYAPFVGALRPLFRSLPPERLHELVGPGRRELARLFPDLGAPERASSTRLEASSAARAHQARLFEIVFGVLHRLADQQPVVLILEDLHWADSSTRDLLRFLVRNGRDSRFLFVASYRSDELHRRHPLRSLLAELQRLPTVDDIELPAFDSGELAAQLAGITGEHADPELVETVLARSGGNPFFVEELVAAGEASLALPRSLRDTLEHRVRQTPSAVQRLVRIASVAGPRIDHRLLAAVAGLSEAELTATLRESIEHHLLVPTSPDEPPGYAFRHALVQEVVYEELLPNERTQLHTSFAHAIEATADVDAATPSGSAAQLAHHWLMAHDLERALPAVLRAARVAAGGFAFAEAQALLERALELWPQVASTALPANVDRPALLVEAAEAAAHAGDPRRSIDFVRSALSEIDPVREAARAGVFQHKLAWYLNEAGDWQTGVVALERAVELIPIDPPTPERARVLSDLAHSLMVRGRFGESLALAEAALAISRAVGARAAEARSLSVLGLDLACRSDFERSLPILREGHALALELGDPLAIFLTAVGLGWALDESGRHRESWALAETTRERIHHLGADARFGGQLASKAARALYELGRWDEAEALLDETIESAPTRYAMRWLLSNRVRLRALRGQLDAARLDLARYEALGERVIGPDPDLMRARRAEIAIVAGEFQVARDLVRDTLDQIAEPELDADARGLIIIGLRAEAEEADAARTAGDDARLDASLAALDDLEERMRRHVARVGETAVRPARIIDADRALADALVSRARGVLDPEGWQRAADLRRAIGRPYELAMTLAYAAQALLAQRRRTDGSTALAEAHAIAVALGAAPLRDRIEAVARRYRVLLDGVDSAERHADRLGLTPREREVLVLLAEGRTNRQIGEELFMAESTAGVHVSHILSKLGVQRRSEAAVLAHRIGLSGLG
jgi:DNA-binding NarL/FixJ family response regulator